MPSLPDFKRFVQQENGSRRGFAVYVKAVLENRGIKPASILDVGCGTGTTARYMAETLPRAKVLATDVKPHLAHWNGNRPDNLTFMPHEAFKLSKTGLKTDAAMLIGVIHHVPQEREEELLADVRDTLNAKGTLIIHEHRLSTHRVRARIEKILLGLNERLINGIEGMGCADNFFTRKRLNRLLLKSGFRVLHTEDTEGKFVSVPTLNGNMTFFCEKN